MFRVSFARSEMQKGSFYSPRSKSKRRFSAWKKAILRKEFPAAGKQKPDRDPVSSSKVTIVPASPNDVSADVQIGSVCNSSRTQSEGAMKVKKKPRRRLSELEKLELSTTTAYWTNEQEIIDKYGRFN